MSLYPVVTTTNDDYQRGFLRPLASDSTFYHEVEDVDNQDMDQATFEATRDLITRRVCDGGIQ